MEYTEYTADGTTITVPRRFADQKALEAYSANLDDQEFGVLCAVLKDRRWTNEEFASRIVPLRPDHSLFQPVDENQEDDQE